MTYKNVYIWKIFYKKVFNENNPRKIAELCQLNVLNVWSEIDEVKIRRKNALHSHQLTWKIL